MKDILSTSKLSEAFRVVYWIYVKRKYNDPSDIPGFYDLSTEEQAAIFKISERKTRRMWNPDKALIAKSFIYKEFSKCWTLPKIKATRRVRRLRTRTVMSNWLDTLHWREKNNIFDRIGEGDPETIKMIRENIGAYVKFYYQQFVNARIDDNRTAKRRADSRLWEKMRLYECSGELEADYMHSSRIAKIARARGHVHSQENRTTYYDNYSWLNFGTDGGGQAETRFAISGSLPSLVCNMVASIGSSERNGGHIHMNCKTEAIGERVFDALRYHLSWFRWLVPSHRRNHRWCPVNGVQSNFRDAQGVKQAAVSCNTWSRTRTVEVRLWPTSAKASDWYGRRDLMQAIARWSETNPRPTDDNGVFPAPINQETQPKAWREFYTWAAVNAPDGLRYALMVLRKKSRNASLGVDHQQAKALYDQFLASGITVRGFRRRARKSERQVTQPEPANHMTSQPETEWTVTQF